MLDRVIGVIVLAAFAPALALLTLLVLAAGEGPAFEWRLRIEDGNLYRTRRFRAADGGLSRFLSRYALDNLPALLDIASGRARLEWTVAADADGTRQIRVEIRAPKAKMVSQPSAARASHISRIAE